MLILMRYPGESIYIGENIIVTLLGQRDGATRIGIDAPMHVKILRGELKEKNHE